MNQQGPMNTGRSGSNSVKNEFLAILRDFTANCLIQVLFVSLIPLFPEISYSPAVITTL